MSSIHHEETCVWQAILSMRKTLAKKFVTNLYPEFVQDVRNLNFISPPRLDGKPSSRGSVHSTEASSDVGCNEMVGNSCQPCGDFSKRVNRITEFLLQFEEKCQLDKKLTEASLRALRSLNRGVLGKILDNFMLFKHQHSLLIAINILMFNSSKMRIPKDDFKDMVTNLFQRGDRELTIHSIKKSKTYSLIKQVIRTQL